MGNPLSSILSRGDIVLVPFPFTDLSGRKVRPALVVSARNDADVSVAFISSVVPADLMHADFLLPDSHPDFSMTGLKKASVFRMDKVVTLQRSIILRRLGKISPSIGEQLDTKFKRAFGIE
jgi:mRNA interferase MazF